MRMTAKAVLTEYMQAVVRNPPAHSMSTDEHVDLMIAALADAGLRVVPMVSTAAMYKAFHSVDCMAGVDVRLLFEKRYRAMVEAANE